MPEPLLGEIKMTGFNFAPKGYAMCNGQLLPINQNQALFSILGTTYGGNGTTTFALPNLQGRVPVHTNGSSVALGELAGEATHTLTMSEMPGHTHQVSGNSAAANATTPVGNVWAQQTADPYSPTPNTPMHPSTAQAAGGSQPHDNMQPYLTINFVIALQGVFPTRN